MAQKTQSSGISIGFTGLLQLIFITLKLCGVIEWSWFWVLCPMWSSISLALLIILIYFTILKIAQ